MRKLQLFIVVVVLVLSSFSAIAEKQKESAIYGKDNRVEIKEFKNRFGAGFKRRFARSVAAMISNEAIKKVNFLNYQVKGINLEDSYKLCPGERFAKQLSVASCTGFLVAADTLVTAGHCIEKIEDCSKVKWVFDYREDKIKGSSSFKVNRSKVYSCSSVVKSVRNLLTGADYAVVKLDRKVLGRKPLKFRKEGKVSELSNLVIIGHPSGLPAKIADKAKVVDNSKLAFFLTNLDSFGGNSGSPVFDMETGLVEGILVRGERDYSLDFFYSSGAYKLCYRAFSVQLGGSVDGEAVTRMSTVFK